MLFDRGIQIVRKFIGDNQKKILFENGAHMCALWELPFVIILGGFFWLFDEIVILCCEFLSGLWG